MMLHLEGGETRLRYDLRGADEFFGKSWHPQILMDELSKKLWFTIIKADPVPMGDCWIFTITGADVDELKLPPFIHVMAL